ncbi:aromatic-ring hydroxylase C-terminal domain-containing protein [Streptomyces sp. 8N114]|uniref:aromatic-ring hydroxylase C-terminal domain-containing protein n=1 Tax=Streptomyces sp. 8N114 TaxID=3457419 RepID=UPI003FD18A3F
MFPGDRAPDAHLATARGNSRVFDLLRGPHFTLLAVGGAVPPAGLPAYVRVYAIPPTAPYAPDGLCLVRPDGYLALITGDPGEVTAYLVGLREGRPAGGVPVQTLAT